MKTYTLFIAAFVATLAIAQAQSEGMGPPPTTNWKACNTTKDCTSNGFVCTPSPFTKNNICVNETLYPNALTNSDCYNPYSYDPYTCPYFFNASSPTTDWGFCLNTT